MEQIYCMGGVDNEQVITELAKFGLRIMMEKNREIENFVLTGE